MHSAPIPRVGGIGIILAMLVTTLVWYALTVKAGFIAPLPGEILWSILVAAAGLGALGFLDDSRLFSVRVRDKLIVVIALAAVTVFGFRVSPGAISVFNLFEIPEFYSDIIAVLWIVGLVNAYNLVDGLDGFAGTISILSLAGIIVVSVLCGCAASAVLGLFAAGATLGFMRYNAPPAKVFMGDTGSWFIGFLISIMTIRAASLMEGSGKVPLVMPLLAGLPILEVFVTILRRYFKANENGHPIKQILKYIVTADSSHIHHRYLFRGFSHLETCILVGVLAATIVGSAVAITLAPLKYAPWIAVYLIIPVSVSLYKLGFGGRFKRALKISSSRLNNYHKPDLIGVIETDGKLFNYLSGLRIKGFAFVPLVNERDLPSVANGLKGAIARGGSDLPEMAVRIARELSSTYGFSPLPYTGKPATFNIIANRKAVMADTAPIDKALRRFADGHA
jgi:UDP-GlcNAc:undecaprenyl-phosphate GlcNAc-1-phosphate transferase